MCSPLLACAPVRSCNAPRSTAGAYHRAVHLYLFNSQNEVLLQRRAPTVDHFPGLFGISVTGHVRAGECSSDCVQRELEEELGLGGSAVRCDFVFSFFQEAILHPSYIDRQFNDIYIARADFDLGQIAFDRAEVAEAKFVPFERFWEMALNNTGGLAPVYANECRDLVYFLSNLEGV